MNLYKITTPYLNLDHRAGRKILVTPTSHGEESFRDLANVEVMSLKTFLKIDEKNQCSAIIIKGVFGVVDFPLSQQALQKAMSFLQQDGILSFDINPIEKNNTAKLKEILNNSKIISNNALISREAIKTALSENFELVTFKDSRSVSVPDICCFRYIKPVHNFPKKDTDKKKKEWKLLGRLTNIPSKSTQSAEANDDYDDIYQAISGKYIHPTPRILLIGTSKWLADRLKSTLSPKKIISLGILAKRIRRLSDGSFDFIYVGGGTGRLSSSEYLKLVENTSRLRSKRGCVLIKNTRVENTVGTQLSKLDSKTWSLNYINWAKSRHSFVKSETLSIGSHNYLCVSVESPYGLAIKQDILNGNALEALLNFKNYSSHRFFTSSEAARIVRAFQALNSFYEALYIFATNFSVLDAVKFDLLRAKHNVTPIFEIVEALITLEVSDAVEEAVIFDLIGEFYRLSHDKENTIKYWTKSLSIMEDVGEQDKKTDILRRKIKLFVPCGIETATDLFSSSDMLASAIILAEPNVSQNSLKFLAHEYNVSAIFSPTLKEQMKTISDVKFKPIMGLVPVDSTINKVSHEYAGQLSYQIITALIENSSGDISDWFETYKISLALTIEDFLARHLLTLEAYAVAANTHPESDIILTGNELGYFDTSRSLLFSRLSHKKVWIHSQQPKSDLSLYQDLWDNKNLAKARLGSESYEPKINDWFNELSKTYRANLEDYFSALRPELKNTTWIAGNLANRYFGESMVSLGQALNETGEAPVIIDSSTTRNASTDYTGLWESCSQNEGAMDIPVLGMLRPKINENWYMEGLSALKNWVQNVIEPLPIKYNDTPASFAFSHLLAKTLSRDIPILLYSNLFAKKLMSLGEENRLITVSTREPHDHIFADFMQSQGIVTTLVQCTETIEHPRYKTPLVDYVTAIDQIALETFTNYFSVPKQAVTITGSPRSQINFRTDRIKAMMELLDERGLSLNPPIRILFATGTGRLDENLDVLSRAARFIKTIAGAQLIVKTHPREDPIRLAAYSKTLSENNLGGMSSVLNKGVAETLILLSDYVISFPSNLVHVALDMGKRTLVYNSNEEGLLESTENEKDHYLISNNLEDFSRKIKTLLSKPPSDQNLSQNQRDSLKQICNVIKGQERPRLIKAQTMPACDKKVPLYSSLSFIEISNLIKQQATKAGADSVDVNLFKKALVLAKSEEDFVVILSNLAHYAPQSLMAAEFFNDLSHSARGANLFCETIGDLQSPKLAKYAAQLEQKNVTLSIYTILAMAQSYLAVGQVEEALDWYDLGLAQKGPNPLRSRIEDERGALSLLSWTSDEEEGDELELDAQRVLVVAERGTDSNIYGSFLSGNIKMEVYFDGKAGETLGDPNKVKSKSSRDMLDDRAPEIDAIIHRANMLAKHITAQILKELKTSQHIAWLKDIRPAIEMELRAGLITQLRRHAAFQKAISGPYDMIVCACHTPTFLALFSDSLDEAKMPIFVVGASQSPQRRRAFGAARRQGLAATRKKQETLLKSLKAKNTSTALRKFDDILNAILPRVSERHDTQSVIAVTSWRITTIKDGCLSLLKHFPPDVPITIFDTSRQLTDSKRFLSDINNFAKLSDQDIRPFSAQYHNKPNPNLRTLKGSDLAKKIFMQIKQSQEGKKLGHAIQLGIWNQIGILLYKTIPMLYDLHIQLTRICKQSDASVLMVMPGRDAESLTAQNAVKSFGVKMADIQTAYFSRGHTYTAPSGDVVTAMDEWSEEAFIERFKIPQSKIYNIGTSRFDRFSKLRISHETVAQASKQRPNICLATQPIQSEFTKEILHCLNDLYHSGIDFDCTVKLHPRQSESIISEIESIASDLKKDGRLKITKHGDLAQILLNSDVLVTAFSNVAVEAALMNCPVLIANFTGDDIPIPFMEFGIAEEARTRESFESLARAMLYDEDFILKMKKKRQSYFKRHSSQWNGEAGKNTAALIISKMARIKSDVEESD